MILPHGKNILQNSRCIGKFTLGLHYTLSSILLLYHSEYHTELFSSLFTFLKTFIGHHRGSLVGSVVVWPGSSLLIFIFILLVSLVLLLIIFTFSPLSDLTSGFAHKA